MLASEAIRFAQQVDIGDAGAVGRGLGTALLVRPYCTHVICGDEAPLGVAHQYPDPPVHLPGAVGLTAQYFAAQARPRFGIMAALDMFLPQDKLCLTRSEIRAELGQESFQGSRLGQDEPPGTGLNYVVRREPSFRTVVEFVFSGPVVADGCLALINIRKDTFGVRDPATGHNKLGPLAVQDLYMYDESDFQTTQPSDLMSPTAEPTPLGLTLDAFLSKFPTCKAERKRADEQVSPLTDVAPPAIPLLPVFHSVFLATEHSVWNTSWHGAGQATAGLDLALQQFNNWDANAIGSGRAPALDATLITLYGLRCMVPHPNPQTKYAWDKVILQRYEVLVYKDRVLAIKNPSQSDILYVPAGIAAAEINAYAGGKGTVLTQLPFPLPFNNGDRSEVIGFEEGRNTINVVRALGPSRLISTNLMDSTRIENVVIDRRLWQDYVRQVQLELSRIRAGVPALWVAEPIGQRREANDKPIAAHGELPSHIEAFILKGDLLDYAAFGRAMGKRSVLLSDGFVRDAVSDSSPSSYTVGLMPGKSLLDGIPFTYKILPAATPDSEHRMPPYHRLVAELDIGGFNHVLQSDVCITRAGLEAAFGANQTTNPARSPGFVHKFQAKSQPADTIYVSFSFNAPQAADGNCAQSVSLSQYRHIVD